MLTRDPFFGRQAAKPAPSTQPVAAATAHPTTHAHGVTAHDVSPRDDNRSAANSPTAKNDELRGSQLIVGPNIKLKGVEITDCDTLVVEGHVEATMDSRAIQIAQNGTFSGTAGIDIAEIRGGFSGELMARKCLTIYASGKVSGKIRYGKVVIEEGGEITGDIKKLSEEEKTARIQKAVTAGRTATLPVSGAQN